MSVIQGNAFSDDAVDTGDIGHSLRFRGAQHLNRTFGTPTANTSWACSWWQKDCTDGATKFVLGAGLAGFGFHSSNVFRIWDNGGGGAASSTALFRDPTGHSHYLVRSNGTNIKAYRNNEEIVSYTGTITSLNSAIAHLIGRYANAAQDYLNDYISRFAFVDNGGSLTPGDFAYLNTEINEWVTKSQSAVKAVVDAGGTNSFMLDFDDATSLTTLGYDKSSKGNNWTLNNFSLTAGTTYDHMLDVPGNSYATLNPLDTAAQGSSITHSAGNLQIAYGTSAWRETPSSIVMTSGKWYAEADVTQGGAGTALLFGASTVSTLNNSSNLGNWAGSIGIGKGTAGAIFAVEGSYPAAPHSIAANDRNLVAIDCDAGKAWLGYYDASVPSTTWYSSAAAATGNPVTGANPTMTFTPGTPIEFVHGIYATGTAYAAYFGASGFAATQPTGFKALCQANLPDVAIKNPKLYFDIKTRAGNGTTQTQIGMLFGPGFKWTKDRSAAYNNVLADKVRGANQFLYSNTTGAEATSSGCTFNSDGYTVGSSVEVNNNGSAIVDWLWKAGGAAVSNTAGSITSQVSANVDAGFSVVTYTGTGANATVGHGLTKVPKLVIVKQRTAGTVENWAVSHTGIANTEYLLLNTTAAKTAGATYWNSTTPTTSVFSVGSAADTNESAKDFVAYCFADIEGYSKAFSYTGNGSADGPYVHLGFKPRWILVKCSSNAGLDWFIWDTARDTYNQVARDIYPNATNAEELNNRGPDVTSSGFKLRNAATYFNGSGYTYIGFAIADVAGKYSLGR